MRRSSFLSLCLLWISGLAYGQLTPEVIKAERTKLLEKVGVIPKTGAPGPVAVWGALTFPILAGADGAGDPEFAVAAVAGYGKGRIILFGHNAYLDGELGADHEQLLKNCVRWASKKQSPKIGLSSVKEQPFWMKSGMRVSTMRDLSSSSLRTCDVILINAQGASDKAQGEALLEWVKNGGALIAGMTGWAFEQTSKGKNLAEDHGLNLALLPAGIAFTDMSVFRQLQSFQARAELPLLINAGEAIARLKQKDEKGSQLTTLEAKQAATSIQTALASQPSSQSVFRENAMAVLGGQKRSDTIPTKQSPLTQAQHSEERIKLGMAARMMKTDMAEKVAAHPAHEVFPGKVPDSAPRITTEVAVKASIPGWRSTGVYAAAGDTITVTIPQAMVDKGYAVRIGCHSDILYALDSWSRVPDITKTIPLNQVEVKVSSAFGGLLYIVVPNAVEPVTENFNVVLSGGIAAPLFVLGQDSDEQWNSEIKNRPAPWAELACDKIILTVPTEVARTVTQPSQLMEFWKHVVEVQDDISNQAAERKRPERMVADVQISAGFMHSGYPIMLHLPEAMEMVTYNRIRFPGWGFHHEIGHNHQKKWFTFDGTVEVTNNVLCMYVYEAVLKKDWLIGHTAILPERRKENVEKIKRAADKWAAWKSDPFLALTTYIQLVQAFGWESWRAYLHSFSQPEFGPMPATDDEARDQFLVRYSKITKKNLGLFFDAWGIPVSASAKAQINNLEPWMPVEMQ